MKRMLLLLLLLLAGCKQTPVPVVEQASPLMSCYLKLGNPPDPTRPGWIAERSHYDMHLYSGNAWSSPRMQAAADTLRQRNPRVLLGEYASTMAIGQWVIQAVARGDTGWSRQYYDATMPYLARTNGLDPVTGLPDTASIFLRNYCVNLLLPGAVDAVAGFHASHSVGLDWLMLDFMTIPMPDFRAGQGPRYVSEQAGDMDLDQDGVAHAEDMDERTALRSAFIQLLDKIHALAPNLKLIPNGQLAMLDDEVARHTDGVYVEGFPQWFFGPGFNFRNAVFQPDYVPSMHSLTRPRYRNGRGLVLIEDRYHQMQHGFIAAGFEGAVEVRRNDDAMDTFIPDGTRDIRWLGMPTGPAVVVGDTLRRPFENGVLRLVSTSVNGFSFRVEVQP